MDIEEARKEINCIDEEMAKLFERRMKLVGEISREKKEKGLPVLDSAREKALVEKNKAFISDPGLIPYYTRFETGMISLSKEYQKGKNRIVFGDGVLSGFGREFPISGRTAVITGKGVPPKYAEAVRASLTGCETFLHTVTDGEKGKTVENASSLLSVLFEDGLTRADSVVAVGGGSLLDLVGLTCAVFGRGIPCYYVPTTLLSQADASVGGKTAVNFGGVKNSVGCFALPAGVMIDVSTLSSLPERQFESGMAEIIKIAAVLDAGLFEMLEKGEGELTEIIKRAVGLKNEIVGLDFRDEGTRRVLNFGHTVGHAVEMAEGLLHGEAICPGMLCMSEGEAKDRLTALISRHGLPTSINTNANALLPLVMKDKKGEGKKINCIICDRIGSYRTEKLDAEEISARIGRITKG